MKTETTNQKYNLIKLTKVLGIGALLSLGLKANAQQQCIANYNYANDSVNTGNVIFTNTSSIGNTSLTYSWDFGDGTTSNLENPNHIFSNFGSSSTLVCLTVADLNGTTCTFCDSVFTGGNNGSGCQAYFYSTPDSNSVNGLHFWNYSAGTQTTFSWEFGDSTTSTLENPNHVYANSGTYQVCLTIGDSSGVTCSYCESVVIGNQNNGGCLADFYSYADSSSISTINFINYSGGTPTGFSWDFGDNTTSSLENPTHAYANQGTYNVCLTIGDSSGVTCSFCSVVVVGNGGCQANFYSYADSSSTNSINFLNYSAGTATNFSWDFGDNTASSLENPNHVFANPGTYTVCLTISDSIGSICTHCDNIIVGNQNGSGCNEAYFYSYTDSTSNTISFGDTSIVNFNSYFWDFGDSTNSNVGNPNHVYSDSGSYVVCLTIVDQNGNTCTYCNTVTARNLLIAGINDSKKINTLLENYPNPFNGSTTINYSISKNSKVELNVVDLMGNKIATIESGNKSAGNFSSVWSAENVAGGMYLLQLNVNDQFSTKRIIITK